MEEMMVGARVRRASVALAFAICVAGSAAASASAAVSPNFGSNVVVLSPSMPQSAIQAKLDAISTQQVPNQFGTQRYAILFEPGTYGSATDPLDF